VGISIEGDWRDAFALVYVCENIQAVSEVGIGCLLLPCSPLLQCSGNSTPPFPYHLCLSEYLAESEPTLRRAATAIDAFSNLIPRFSVLLCLANSSVFVFANPDPAYGLERRTEYNPPFSI